MVTLVESTGSSTKGFDATRDYGTSFIRGGFGAGKVVRDLKFISTTPRA